MTATKFPSPRAEPVGDLLAVDPGVSSPGAALFRAGVLVAATAIDLDDDLKSLDRADRCDRVAEEILRWGVAHKMDPRYVVFEWPQWYSGRKSKGDPNDLGLLVGVGQAVVSALRILVLQRERGLVKISPLPAEWTGGVPKDTSGPPWESPRGRRVRARLSREELLAFETTRHDSVDAAGLGLWALGRFAPHRNFPGATS